MAIQTGGWTHPAASSIRKCVVLMMLAMLMVVGTLARVVEARGPERPHAAPIHAAATWAGVAPELLAGIVWAESGGHPWALGIGGEALYPRTRAEAVALIRDVSGRADIGLAQIHYPIWGPAFGLRPEDLLDPWINLHVAARILRFAIAQEPGSWGGVGRYHSATPWRKWQYASRVAAVVRALRPAILPERTNHTP